MVKVFKNVLHDRNDSQEAYDGVIIVKEGSPTNMME